MLNSPRTWPGLIAGLFILGFNLAALVSLLFSSTDWSIDALWQDPYLQHITLFSLKQALLSTFLSISFALPIAIALYRRNFWGKAPLLKICTMTLVLPVLIGVFGLLAIYGKQGLVRDLLSVVQFDWQFSIYGLNGILLAHVFFNLPFCVQLFLSSLERIPAPQTRLARQLGLTPWTQFKTLEWPHLKQQIPHSAQLVFMLCFTSFSTVMALGGGPQATTIELAIYQAIRFDFDLQTGAMLALWQLLLCGGFQLCFAKWKQALPQQTQHSDISMPAKIDHLGLKIWDSFWIALFLCFILPPLFMVFWAGLNTEILNLMRSPTLLSASFNSIWVAFCSASVALSLAIGMSFTWRYWKFYGNNKRSAALDFIANSVLVVPSIVLATGLFLLLREYIDVFTSPYSLVIAVNGLLAVPFALNQLNPAALQIAQHTERLCLSLGIHGRARWQMIDWPLLRQTLGKAFALSFVLSTGDLGAIALVGSQDFQTLPLYLFQLLGSYQMDAAAAAALMLLLISLGSYYGLQACFLRRSDAHR